MANSFTSILQAWPLTLLVLVYIISMVFLIRLFSKTYAVIRQHPGNGLEFYRKLVAISIIVTMLDATYAVGARMLHWFYPIDDYLLYGLVPITIKTLVLVCIWGFHTIQLGKAPLWLSWSYWVTKFKAFFLK